MSNEKIQKIIQQRQPFAGSIDFAKKNFENTIKQFVELKGKCASALASEALSTESEKLSQIFKKFNSKQADELQAGMVNIHKRLSRPTLNIAVIGLARQGKSKLLQTITGLSPDIIPDSDRVVCTGVRSDIINDPEVSEPCAYVNFLSEEEFIRDTIGKYFRELKKHGAGFAMPDAPETLGEFKYCVLPDRNSFTTKEIEDETRMRNYIGELKKLQENLPEYQSYLGSGKSSKISGADIKKFVVQNDAETGEEFHLHMAVKSLEIHCAFPRQDVGALKLIDLPGLGDTRIGDTERMIEALSDQVDLVFFVTMPRNTGDDVFDRDINLYSQAKRALGRKLPIERWSFWVINHNSESDNLKQCRDFEQTLKTKDVEVASSIIVDCKNKEEVSEKLIGTALDFLEKNIAANDREYARSLQIMMNDTVKSLHNVLAEAKEVFSASNNFEQDCELFDRLFDNVWDDLIDGLVEAVEPDSPLGQKKNESCQELRAKFNETLEREEKLADNGKLDNITIEIVKRLGRKEGFEEGAYYKLLHQLRTDLAGKVQQDLDDTLRVAVLIPMKEYLCKILAENGKLKLYFKAEGIGLLSELINFINDGKKDIMPTLLEGFMKLDEAMISCQNRIQPLIRDALNLLDPNTEESKQRKPVLTNGDGVFSALLEIYKDTLAKLRENLDKEEIYSEPNEFAFSVANTFIDDLTRKNEISHGDIMSLETQWRAFYRYIRGKIWPEEFGHSQARAKAYDEIGIPVQKVLTSCEELNFVFSDTREVKQS